MIALEIANGLGYSINNEYVIVYNDYVNIYIGS